MKVYAVRKIKFDSGHRVVGHEGKCQSNHGHEYWAHFYAESATGLDSIGRVVDFSILKDIIGKWIDNNWDHNMIIWKQDPNLGLLQQCEGIKKPFVVDFNPTAENLAKYLIETLCPLLLQGSGVSITKIQLFETSNCYVEVLRKEHNND